MPSVFIKRLLKQWLFRFAVKIFPVFFKLILDLASVKPIISNHIEVAWRYMDNEPFDEF